MTLPRSTSIHPLFLSLLFVLASALAAAKPVTYGSAIKLVHVESGSSYYLDSTGLSFGGSGSGQQAVTLVKDGQKRASSSWLLRAAHGAKISDAVGAGRPVQCGDVIRLTHLQTMVNLHTHNIPSPLSKQQEVSGFGEGDGEGDGGDNWKVECAAGKQVWERKEAVQLKHVDTGAFLGSAKQAVYKHAKIEGHLEVFGRSTGDGLTKWKVVDEGVHLSK